MKFHTIVTHWTLTAMASLLCWSLQGTAAAAEPRIYDHDRATLVAGGTLQPGHLQHTVTLSKPVQIQGGVRHAEYKLSTADGRQFSAVHHREDGRDGVTGLIEARDEHSGKVVKWHIYPAGFQQVCHDGSTIDVVAEDEGRRVYMSHSGGKTMVMDYDATKTPAEREQLDTAASVVVHNWCPLDQAHRSALAAAHYAGNADLGVSAKSFASFFTHTIPSFFGSIGKKMCSVNAAAKTAICGTAAAVAGLGTAAIVLKATGGQSAAAAKKAAFGVGITAFGGCGTAFAAGCK